MPTIQIRSEEDFEKLLDQSTKIPVLLFKHSTQCPVSSAAFEEFNEFADRHPEATCALVLVIESRPASNHIARFLGVQHESPQAIVIDQKVAAWNASHYAISVSALEKALSPVST